MSGIGTRWRALPLGVRDGLLAVALSAVGQVELLVLADEVRGSLPLQHAAFLVMTGSVAARRVRPLAAVVAGAAGLAAQTLVGHAPVVAGFLALLVLTWSVAQYTDRRRDALAGLAAVLVAVEVYPFVAEDVSVGDEVANAVIPTLVWFFARLARERLDRAVSAERAAACARERALEEELAGRAAVAAERRRIAREMHDVVGHGVTLMLLHAEAAQARLGGREPAVSTALDVVLQAGRTAVDDLHRLLRVLRDGAAPDDEAPGSVAAVDGLVEAAARAGLDVEVVERPARPLPSAVEATAYRIVQESLTNALKYAATARVRVRLHDSGQALEVDVSDDGASGSEPSRRGYGLAGIRERVALFDGWVTAGPREDGPGWQVHAVLPVPRPAQAVA